MSERYMPGLLHSNNKQNVNAIWRLSKFSSFGGPLGLHFAQLLCSSLERSPLFLRCLGIQTSWRAGERPWGWALACVGSDLPSPAWDQASSHLWKETARLWAPACQPECPRVSLCANSRQLINITSACRHRCTPAPACVACPGWGLTSVTE